MISLAPAPEWRVSEWLNSDMPLSLAGWRGRTVVALAFQMLCPGCVSHALPQLQQVHETFPDDQVTVAAIHTVFEHHEAQGRTEVLRAFVHENRIRYPVAIDEPHESGVPLTFSAYHMQGTPTLLVIDSAGRLRLQKFGHLDDMRLSAIVAGVVAESRLIDAADAAS
jgi:hypothetical protein